MLEFVIVLLIVAIAIYFTAGKVIDQIKGRGCGNCNGKCRLANRTLKDLIGAAEKNKK